MMSTRIRTCDRLSSTDGDQATRGSSVTERSNDPPRTRDGNDPSGGHFSSANRLAKYAVASATPNRSCPANLCGNQPVS